MDGLNTGGWLDGLNTGGWLVLGCYASLLLLLSWRRGTRADAAQAAGAFLTNNRASKAALVSLSIVASCIGASATVGVAGMAFETGTPAFWWLGCGALGLLLMSTLLARKVRDSGASTLPEMAETFLGRPARLLISVIIVVAWTALVAAQLTALTRFLSAMTGLAAGGLAALALATLLVAGHALGGQAAILRLDRWQSPFIAGGLVLLLAALWRANPGWTSQVRLEAVNERFSAVDLAGYALVIGSNYLVCPMLFGRFFSAKDSACARRGGLWAALGLAFFSALVVSVGLACRGLLAEGTARDAALLGGLQLVLPGFLGLLVMGALVAAVVSSADSCLVTAGTVLGNDLLKRKEAGTLRICVALLALCSAWIASRGGGILESLFIAYTIFASGVVMPVFIGLLLPKGWRIEARYAAAAVALGGALGVVSALTESETWVAAGMLLGAIVTGAGARRAAGGG